MALPGGPRRLPRPRPRRGASWPARSWRRLRASERLRAHVAALTRHHLRLGFLVHDAPLDRRAVHRYLVATAPVSADVTLLTVADRLATRGRNAEPAIARHVELAARPARRGARASGRPARPRPSCAATSWPPSWACAPGPQLGALLDEIEEARYAGEVATADEAVALARRALGAGGGRRRPAG